MGSIDRHENAGLSVLVVGAGVAGLATATALAQKKHTVTVLEAKPALNEFGASIGITANGVRPLKAWGLHEAFEKVVTKNGFLDFRDGFTGEMLGHMPHNKNNVAEISYGEEIWNINRRDLQDVLADAAVASGAKIVFGAELESIDIANAVVVLKDGSEMAADVIVGADGIASTVRHCIPGLEAVEPISRGTGAYRCTVQKEKMRGNPKLQWLLESGDEYGFLGPRRYVLSWPMREHRSYDVVVCPKSDINVPAGRWGTRGDPDVVRAEYADFCPTIVELLKHIDTCVKWRIAELPPLETCRSSNGKVVVIGDAWHAMLPHAASGGNSALEDSACLAECLDWAFRAGKPIETATKHFEQIRQPRVNRIQAACHEGVAFLDGEEDFVPIRAKMLAAMTKGFDADMARPEAERRSQPRVKGDMNATFPTEPYVQWLYGYDAIAVAKEYLSQVQ